MAVEFRPDLVLLDLVMPKADGADVARQIRADPRLGKTPIVFLSGSIVNNKEGPTEIAGFPALAKPIGIKELLEAIEAHVLVS